MSASSGRRSERPGESGASEDATSSRVEPPAPLPPSPPAAASAATAAIHPARERPPPRRRRAAPVPVRRLPIKNLDSDPPVLSAPVGGRVVPLRVPLAEALER